MRRRRKKNPEPVTMLLLLGGAALVAGAVALVARNKKKHAILVATNGAQFAASPAFTSGVAFAQFSQIRVGDCLTVVNGQAGFSVPGVPNGENVAVKVDALTGGDSLLAHSIDPRTPAGLGPISVSAASISGAGDC